MTDLKWCYYCGIDSHNDSECWSTRPALWGPTTKQQAARICFLEARLEEIVKKIKPKSYYHCGCRFDNETDNPIKECLYHSLKESRAVATALDNLKTSCSKCEYSESDGSLVDHCSDCQRKIVTALHCIVDGKQNNEEEGTGTFNLKDPPDSHKFREQVIIASKATASSIDKVLSCSRIAEIRKLKRCMEQKILKAVSEAISEFSDNAEGLSPSAIYVSMTSVNMIGVPKCTYVCTEVRSSVDI